LPLAIAGDNRHDGKREIQAVAQRSDQLLEQGLPKRLHGTPAWTGNTKKTSDFRADELLVTTPAGVLYCEPDALPLQAATANPEIIPSAFPLPSRYKKAFS
jgi:hypothetical protein